METKLQAAFTPLLLEITDDSAKHAGHAGAQPGGETHFSVRIVSDKFAGQNRVARHRAVYAAVDAELKERVHALAVTALTPEEI